jgi:c-di-GMP-binding flagellar brake protein YcgR
LSEKVRPDKRRYLRYEILDYAVVQLNALGTSVNTVIADISLGGLQLRSKEPFPVGALCIIRVGVADCDPINLRAEVRHCKPLEDSELFTTGMRFVPETHADRMAIAEYVHAIFQRQCDNLLV